jgi:predicted lipid-binding transport protein (Tim44 family)
MPALPTPPPTPPNGPTSSAPPTSPTSPTSSTPPTASTPPTTSPTRPPTDDYAPTALPSTTARVLAFASILLGGLCGGLIGWSLVDLSCTGDCGVTSGLAGLGGAIIGAVGVAVVAVLALRAMGEWRTVQHRQAAGSPPEAGTARRPVPRDRRP